MDKYTIRKTYKIEYAHQLKSAFSKVCHETIHGHSGKIEVFLTSSLLNHDGMVIDFGEISALIKKHIMDKYDHALFIPNTFNIRYKKCLRTYNKKLRIVNYNPTAENFAHMLFNEINLLLQDTVIVRLSKVRFHETETGYAEYSY